VYADVKMSAAGGLSEGQRVAYILNIISYRSQWKFGAISLLIRISILASDRTCTAIRTPQAVQANHEKPRQVERSSWPTHQRSPPIADISTPGQRMADNHGIGLVR